MNSLTTPRYAIIPGPVLSRNDSDVHWIGVQQLLSLYQPPRGTYIVFQDPEEFSMACAIGDFRKALKREQVQGLIELRPSYLGDYELPT